MDNIERASIPSKELSGLLARAALDRSNSSDALQGDIPLK